MKANVYVTLVYEVEAKNKTWMEKCIEDLKSQTEFFPFMADRTNYKWKIKNVVDVKPAKGTK